MAQFILKYPSYVIIEPTQGCTRTCKMCSVSPKKSARKFMLPETFARILEQLNDNVKRVDFSLHGEPLLNNYLSNYVYFLRKKLPKVQITIISNGDVLTRIDKSLDRLLSFFKIGLNFYFVDVYDEKSKELFIELIRQNKEELKKNNIEAIRFTKGGINIWSYHGGNNKTILMSDESLGFNIKEKHSIRQIITTGGNLPLDRWHYFGFQLKDFPIYKKCTEPLKCAPIDIHGNVFLCCTDNAKSLKFGNLTEKSMDEIWNSELFQMVRFTLSKGRRDLIPACFFCNRISYRIGLWPYVGPVFPIDQLEEIFYNKSYISPALQNLFDRR